MNTTLPQVREYALHTFEPDDWVELRTINAEKRVRKFWTRARDLSGLVPEFERLNRAGFNIYIGPNPRTGQGQSGDASVSICRCLFLDFDGIEPGDGCGRWDFVEARIEAAQLPMPTMTIFSGHGIHCYWRLDEPLSPDRWQTVQRKLIATLGADRACSNPERLLRLPGFLNHKLELSVECFQMFVGTP